MLLGRALGHARADPIHDLALDPADALGAELDPAREQVFALQPPDGHWMEARDIDDFVFEEDAAVGR